MMRFFGFIPNVIQDLVFCCVGFAANFSPSLAPCARTMVARSRKKMGAAFLQNSQLLNHVRYILLIVIAPCLASSPEQLLSEKLMREIPDWMKAQADRDLAPFRN